MLDVESVGSKGLKKVMALSGQCNHDKQFIKITNHC